MNILDISIVSESGSLVKQVSQSPIQTPVPATPQPHQAHQQQGPSRRSSKTNKTAHKSPEGNIIKVNFGSGAIQDPIYRFKDNSVRTTK